MTTNRTPEPAAPQLQPDGTYLWGGKPLTPRPLTDIDRLTALLTLHGGHNIRLGQTGVRITIAPIPMYTDDAHEQCRSVDIETTGLAHVVAVLTAAVDLTRAGGAA
ncbi:hypothetical protein [Streptomyces halstedii]|uniref:hypothetical protein n=1 Tax=Streptomyces halstedii TaxID=1944 RepID=UPI003828C959